MMLRDINCDHVSGTFNQITSTNQILLYLNHCGTLCLIQIIVACKTVNRSIFESFGAKKSESEESQRREWY